MKEIIGVRFRPNGKIYFFSPGDHDVECGQFVIVETARGVEFIRFFSYFIRVIRTSVRIRG